MPQKTPKTAGKRAADTDAEIIKASGLFDAQWYEARYNAKRAASFNPLRNYLKTGGIRGHAASAKFFSFAYLALNREVAREGANPLVHYLRAGQAGGRSAIAAEDLDGLGFPGTNRREQLSIALLAASPLFDDEYYTARYPDVAQSGLHPLLHYARFGRVRLLNPSAGFDASAYLAAYPQAAASDFVPLVHFLRLGQQDGLTPIPVAEAATPDAEADQPDGAAASAAEPVPAPESDQDVVDLLSVEEKTSLVAQSPIFDGAWYAMQYRDVTKSGLAPASHYLQVGAAERRRPSIYFDPEFYLAQLPEAERDATDPLLHYLVVGRTKGLRPLALLETAPPPALTHVDPIVPSEHAADAAVDFVRHADLATDAPGLACGTVFLGPYAGQAEPEPIALYRRLVKLASAADDRSGRSQPGPGRSQHAGSVRCFGDDFVAGPAGIVDAWFADDLTLTLRVQSDAPEASDAAAGVVLRAFQASADRPDDLGLCAEAALRPGDLRFVPLKLASPVMPVLLTLSEPGGAVLAAALLPFPSLCRGGLHHAELVARAERALVVEDLRRYGDALATEILGGQKPSIGHVLVRPQSATGAEVIFSRPVLDWMGLVFDAKVELEKGAVADTARDFLSKLLGASGGASRAASRSGRGATLTLPADAIPTISALAARTLGSSGDPAATSSYLIAEGAARRPRWLVSLPAIDAEISALQPINSAGSYPVVTGPTGRRAPHGPSTGFRSLHQAIRHRSPPSFYEATMTMPVAPDAGRSVLQAGAPRGSSPVLALLFCSHGPSTRSLMTSLHAQNGSDRLQVEVLVRASAMPEFDEVEQAARSLFGERASVRRAPLGEAAEIAAAADRAPGPHILIARDTIVLHDPRTCDVLLAMADTKDFASSSCLIVQDKPGRNYGSLGFHSAGLFPSHVSFSNSPRLILYAPNCLDALPNATYPVLANRLDLAVVSRDAAKLFAEIAGSESELAQDVSFSLRCAEAGLRRLCTTAVSVALRHDEPAPAEIQDPVGISCIADGRWGELLSSVTIVRALN